MFYIYIYIFFFHTFSQFMVNVRACNFLSSFRWVYLATHLKNVILNLKPPPRRELQWVKPHGFLVKIDHLKCFFGYLEPSGKVHCSNHSSVISHGFCAFNKAIFWGPSKHPQKKGYLSIPPAIRIKWTHPTKWVWSDFPGVVFPIMKGF